MGADKIVDNNSLTHIKKLDKVEVFENGKYISSYNVKDEEIGSRFEDIIRAMLQLSKYVQIEQLNRAISNIMIASQIYSGVHHVVSQKK